MIRLFKKLFDPGSPAIILMLFPFLCCGSVKASATEPHRMESVIHKLIASRNGVDRARLTWKQSKIELITGTDRGGSLIAYHEKSDVPCATLSIGLSNKDTVYFFYFKDGVPYCVLKSSVLYLLDSDGNPDVRTGRSSTDEPVYLCKGTGYKRAPHKKGYSFTVIKQSDYEYLTSLSRRVYQLAKSRRVHADVTSWL